jgi:hypothetical protein
MSEQDAFQVFNIIFQDEPKPPKHYNLRLDNTKLENENINFNDILMEVFFNGMKILFGESTNLRNITQEQYNLINKYMHSLGYSVIFNYEYDDNFPINIKVWFEAL